MKTAAFGILPALFGLIVWLLIPLLVAHYLVEHGVQGQFASNIRRGGMASLGLLIQSGLFGIMAAPLNGFLALRLAKTTRRFQVTWFLALSFSLWVLPCAFGWWAGWH